MSIADATGALVLVDSAAPARPWSRIQRTPPSSISANASRKPGEWQSYDIIFHPPRPVEGKTVNGSFTVLHNGVLVQDHVVVAGDATTAAKFSGVTPRGPILLQDHGNPVHYRNIWVRKLE